MGYCMLTFQSLTAVQRALGYLQRSGISGTIQRTPRWMEEQGCGNALRLNCKDVVLAVEVLKKNRSPHRKAYHIGENGKAAELEL